MAMPILLVICRLFDNVNRFVVYIFIVQYEDNGEL